MVQRLRIHAFTAGGTGSISGLGTGIPHAVQGGQRKSPTHNNKNTYTYTLIKKVHFKKVENTTKQLESKDSENFQTHGSKESEYLQVTTKLGSELSANFLLLSAPPVFRPLGPHPHSRS